MIDPLHTRGEPAKAAGLPVLLSLYLLLLAFFVLLTAHTRFEPRRAEAVTDGVRATFPAASGVPVPGATPSAETGGVLGEAFHRALGRLLEAFLPLAEVERGSDADRITVRLPADRVFSGNEVLAELTPFFAKLGALLAAPPQGARLEVRALVGEPRPGATHDAILRAGALARALAGGGAPAGGLSTGLAGGGTGDVRLAILLADPGAPRVTFGAAP